MEDRIAPPQLDIPTLNAPVSDNMALTVSWSAQNNITGYEVYVSGPVKGQKEHETQIVRVSDTIHTISGINDKKLINYETYKIKVRSVNGDWKSPWSNEQTGIPKPQKLPAPPDYVKAEGDTVPSACHGRTWKMRLAIWYITKSHRIQNLSQW